MREQLQALEAAKLAAMVGGQLKNVDSLAVDGRSTPANKININTFITKVKNPNAPVSNFIPETPHGFAPPVPEDLVQRMVPDVISNNEPTQIAQQVPHLPQPHIQQDNSTRINKTKNQPFNQDSKTLTKINANLKSIKLVLDEMLLLLKQK